MATRQAVRIVIVGDYGVGKSALQRRFARNQFIENPTPRLEAESNVVSINTCDPETGATALMDFRVQGTESVERFTRPGASLYHGAKGVVLVFDVNRQETLDSLEQWYQEAALLCSGSRAVMPVLPAFVLVGAKIDTCNSTNDMPVPMEKAVAFACEHGNMPLFFTSSKTDTNVHEVFSSLAQQIMANPALRSEHVQLVFTVCGNEPRQRKWQCCAF